MASTGTEAWHLRQRKFALLLLAPLLLFLFRTIAQLVQLLWPVSWLPDFSIWHSGTLPYGLLLPVQILILVAMVLFVARLLTGKIKHRPQWSRALKTVGIIYFSLMLFRLIAGVTFLSHLHWFASSIPAFFHLVLATFLLLTGQLHFTKTGDDHDSYI